MNAEFLLIIAIGIVGFIVQAKLQSVFKKYSKVMFPGGLTGRDVAERMLHDNGIYDVKVVSTPGHLTDHYNPATKTVNLSESVYASNSVAAAAVAAHECGHAVQHAKEYAPLKLRSALVPVVSFSSQWAVWVVIAGILMMKTFPALFWVGIAMIAASALFSIVTLPVEYNASARAMQWLTGSYTLRGEQAAQAKEALSIGGPDLSGRRAVGYRHADLLPRIRAEGLAHRRKETTCSETALSPFRIPVSPKG